MDDKSQLELEQWFSDNYKFWMRNRQGNSCFGNEREAFRRAFEWDMIEPYKHNHGKLHEYHVPNGRELDKDTVLNFFKTKCMDMYGKDWEEHYKSYGL